MYSNALQTVFIIEVNSMNPEQSDQGYYYIPITDMTLKLSVFWPSDTDSRINELRFSESISLSFKNEANFSYLLLRRGYLK